MAKSSSLVLYNITATINRDTMELELPHIIHNIYKDRRNEVSPIATRLDINIIARRHLLIAASAL